jgi:hypothetical protein
LDLFSQDIGGYTDKLSYYKGDTVHVYVSTQSNPFNLNIFRIEETHNLVASFEDISGGLQVTRDSAFHYGAGWNVSYSFIVPHDWIPGYYRGEFPTSEGRRGFTFIVKENNHGTYSNILLVASTNTFQAYNEWGGKSLYNYNSTNNMRAYKVSFHRPFRTAYGSSEFYKYEYKFIQWIERNDIKVEIVSNYDVHSNPSLVNNYDVILIVGHNEYWSMQEREAYEQYYEAGGKIIILSGNTNWWQVRLEDEGNTIVCYKSADDDPMATINPMYVTTNWYKDPVNLPENRITGVSFLRGGFVNIRGYYPDSLGYGDYTAVRTHHWIYKGTGLKDGDEFGFENRIVGVEVDGAAFDWVDGIPVVSCCDETPPTFKILALSPAYTASLSGNLGFGTMGYFYNEHGGAVFNAATTGWVDGLGNDPIVDRITFNVFEKFLSAELPPEIISWQPYEIYPAMFNNQPSYVTKRNIAVQPGENKSFSITAENIEGGPVNYYWTKGSEIISRSASLNYVNDNSVKNILTAYAYNNVDTASISWNVFSVDFAIASEPETYIYLNQDFYYEIDVFNPGGSDVIFELLSAPEWLNLDSNVISGTANVSGSYDVSVKAYTVNDEDIQIFTLNVSEITSVNETLPTEFSVSQNYPNPFNPTTTMRYEIPSLTEVSVKVYDVMGSEVKTLINTTLPAGSYNVTWDSTNEEGITAGSGVYFFVVKAGEFSRTIKTLLLK